MSAAAFRGGALAGLLAAACVAPAAAGPVLDRVKAADTVSCGAEERPGFAEAGEDGKVVGLAVEICRAVAVAVLGTDGRIAFSVIDSTGDFDAVRNGKFDVVFLSAGAMLHHGLVGRLLPGPPAFIETESLMVPEASTLTGPRDLAGKSVCFMIGTGAQRAMEAAIERAGVEIKRLGFEEDIEMRDAYNVGRCAAVIGEATFLAEIRQDGGVHHLQSRILDAPLALDPIYLATGIEDGRWSAIADAVLQGLVAASVPSTGWTEPGAAPFSGAATPLGLRDGWSADAVRTTGSYADIWARTLGTRSKLKLDPGPNAPWPSGLMLTPTSP